VSDQQLTKLSACVLDQAGLLQIRAGDEHYPGVLDPVPEALRVGETVHVRMQMPLSATESNPAASSVDVAGALTLIEGGDGPIALSDGLVFELEVGKLSRAPVGESVLPQPPAPMSLRALSRIDDDAKTQGLPADDATASETASETATETIEAADLPDEPFESPINEVPFGWGEDEQQTSNERPAPRRSSSESVFDSTEPSGIIGTLREMTLCDVVQSLEFAGKTAEIMLRPKNNAGGVVYLENGQVVYARTGSLTGDEAFFELAEETRGAFLIRFHAEAPTRNIFMPTGFLLLEVVRRRDEASRSDFERELPRPPSEPVEMSLGDEDLPPPPTATPPSPMPPPLPKRLVARARAELADEVEESEPTAVDAPAPSALAGDSVMPAPAADATVQSSPAIDDEDELQATEPEGIPALESDEVRELLMSSNEGAAVEDLEPAATEIAHEVPAPISTPSLELSGASAIEDDDEEDAQELDEEPEIISIEAAETLFPTPTFVGDTVPTGMVFSGFFREASLEGVITGVTEHPPIDDEPDPTFSSLRMALRGLRASDDEEETAGSPRHAVNTTDSFPSFPG
jgi:hypothetical protein